MEDIVVDSTAMDATSSVESVSTEVPSVDPVASSNESAIATEQVAIDAALPAYNPNFKYSVKGQEKEIDEMFRALVKDAESEKKVKALFEKADGIDHVKLDRDSLKKEYGGFKDQVVPYLQEYHKFTSLRDKGSLGAAFQVAGISDEQIFEYALQKLELSQNPQQSSLYKNHTESSLREIEMETKLQHYQMRDQQMEQYRFQSDLDSSLNANKDIASGVDSKIGRIGAFKEEVIALGVFEAQRGNVLSINDAVEAVANKYKPFMAPVNSIQTQPHQRPATIPNVGSSNVSAIKVKPKSLDDLRKLQQEA